MEFEMSHVNNVGANDDRDSNGNVVLQSIGDYMTDDTYTASALQTITQNIVPYYAVVAGQDLSVWLYFWQNYQMKGN